MEILIIGNPPIKKAICDFIAVKRCWMGQRPIKLCEDFNYCIEPENEKEIVVPFGTIPNDVASSIQYCGELSERKEREFFKFLLR
jgi:hypothetical protein